MMDMALLTISPTTAEIRASIVTWKKNPSRLLTTKVVLSA
jgi:hypothetical protein